MLTQVDVVYENADGPQALALPILGVTPKESLLIRKITGLNPPDANLFIGDYARDGGLYQGRRVGKRNVVITIDLNPNPALGQTVKGLRELLYRILMDPLVDADHTQFVFHDDDAPTTYLYGYAESLESELFGEETMIQASIICPEPYIKDLSETVHLHETGWITVPFEYEGTAETGFELEIHFTNNSNTLTLANNGRSMIISYPFLSGDVVKLNTNRGERSVFLERGGVDLPLIAHLSTSSRWLEIHSQRNSMTVYGATTSSRPAVIKSLVYRANYWGI